MGNKRVKPQKRRRKSIKILQDYRHAIRLSPLQPLNKELDAKTSSRTIKRRLVEKNLFGRLSRKVSMLSKRRRFNRIQFAKRHIKCDCVLKMKKKNKNYSTFILCVMNAKLI